MFSGGGERFWSLKISRCGRGCSCGCFSGMRALGGFIRADDSTSRPAVGKKRRPGRRWGRGGWCSESRPFPSLEHGGRKSIFGEGKIFYSFFKKIYSFFKIAGRKAMSADVSGVPPVCVAERCPCVQEKFGSFFKPIASPLHGLRF